MFYFWMIFILFPVILKIYVKLSMRKCNSNRCLVNKTALITGGSTGIGYQKVLELASRGCKIIIADIEKNENIKEKIFQETQNSNIIYKHLDLSSNDSIRCFADDIKGEVDKIDIIIHNAGCVGFPYTKDGILRTLHVHCLGPFLLTHLLIDLLRKASGARIVFVGSSTVFMSTVKCIDDFNKPPPGVFMQTANDYGNSKLFTLIVAKGFAKRLKKYNIICNTVHPGASKTNLFNSYYNVSSNNPLLSRAFYFTLNVLLAIYGKTAKEAAQTALHCAISDEVKDCNGKFFWNCKPYYEPSLSKNDQFCEEVWRESEKLVHLKPEEFIT